jgi:predicted nucleic acid-binding protein
MRFVLDTTFAIDVLRGQDAAARRFARLFSDGDEPFVSEAVLCELATGARSSEQNALDAFVRAVEFVQPGPDLALLAGRWRGEARSRGLTLSIPDALIAAMAQGLGAVVITRNVRDFAMTPVAVEAY